MLLLFILFFFAQLMSASRAILAQMWLAYYCLDTIHLPQNTTENWKAPKYLIRGRKLENEKRMSGKKDQTFSHVVCECIMRAVLNANIGVIINLG